MTKTTTSTEGMTPTQRLDRLRRIVRAARDPSYADRLALFEEEAVRARAKRQQETYRERFGGPEPQTSDAMTAGRAPDFSVGNPSDEEILEGKGHSDVLVALVTLSMVFGVLLVGLSIYAIVKGLR